MTLSAFIAFGEEKWECPFPHDEPTYKDHKNEFVGSGGTLGDNMEEGNSTANNKDLSLNPSKITSPSKEPGHSLCKLPSEPLEHRLPINLKNSFGDVYPWPVTLAAHHLIPAQASLRDSSLLPWLIKKGKPDTVKTSKGSRQEDGCVKASIGYNVNGVENGIWTPGPYAMRGIWSQFLAFPDEEDENPPDDASCVDQAINAPAESGRTQFDYAVVAMKKAKAQFHDAHPDYSKLVKKSLDEIAAKMELSIDPQFCDKCPEHKDDEFPPPYSLTFKLNGISDRLRMKVSGSPIGWNKLLYLSKKSLEYMGKPKYWPEHN